MKLTDTIKKSESVKSFQEIIALIRLSPPGGAIQGYKTIINKEGVVSIDNEIAGWMAKEDLLWAKQQSEQRKEETIADAKKDADAAWYQWKLGATDDPNLQAQADEEFAAAILIFETKRIAAEMQMEADDRLADAEYEEAMDRCEDMYGSEDEPAPDQYYDYESSSMYAADYESSSMYA